MVMMRSVLLDRDRANLDIGPNDPKRVPINIRLTSSGVVVRKG